jgi:3-dehydroquinate synthase
LKKRIFDFRFGAFPCRAEVGEAIPPFKDICDDRRGGVLVVCDTNTESVARSLIAGEGEIPVAVLAPGEAAKGWASVETLLSAAAKAGLGRDGLFIGVGGGVITDLVAFAASVYMRGASLVLLPTTLLAMADAALGGKTGFDLFDIKNLIGTFRPADRVVMPTSVLASLPRREWLSGLAEVVKTAIIGDEELLRILEEHKSAIAAGPATPECAELLPELVARCVAVKGRIVEADPEERGSERATLNLGHTYGHALESVAGLGLLTHGEAVAWGIARSCELALELGTIDPGRRERIVTLLDAYGYETAAMHPAALAAADSDKLQAARKIIERMGSDKKKKAGALRFIVPTAHGAALTSVDNPEIITRTLVGGLF